MECQREVCPLDFWPRRTSLARLEHQLPRQLFLVLKSAASAIVSRFFEAKDKVSLETARGLLAESFQTADSLLPTFIFQARCVLVMQNMLEKRRATP